MHYASCTVPHSCSVDLECPPEAYVWSWSQSVVEPLRWYRRRLVH
jgi:hypothetical protein